MREQTEPSREAELVRENVEGPDSALRCPVASTLELLGDRWTLVVVRDLHLGKRRFSQFQESPEGIPTNLLTERLRRLEGLGIVERRSYQERPVRYEYHLTEKGRELQPVLRALRLWGLKHVSGTGIPPALRPLLPVAEGGSAVDPSSDR